MDIRLEQKVAAARNYFRRAGCISLSAVLSMLIGAPALSQDGGMVTTPSTRAELPIEIETETSPAGSLKNIPLWKETVELLEDPQNYVCPDDDPLTEFTDENVRCIAGTPRRESFGAAPLPPLTIVNPCHNVLTGQNLRFRPDEEIDWNQPGPLFDPSEVVAVAAPFEMPDGSFIETNIPIEQRTVIGYLVINGDDELVVANPGPNVGDPGTANPMIPPDGTVIAEPACIDGVMFAEDEDTGAFGPVEELEQPPNENHFLEDRYMAEVLGKALFWDMQIGSDGVQACGTCHFNNGVDSRTRNQLNPNHLGGDNTLQVRGPNEDVEASDFPFHRRINPDVVGDGADAGIVVSDANDVMASMGVSEAKQFINPILGPNGFSNGHNGNISGVRPLRPDIGQPIPEPIESMIHPSGQKLRRVEPRNTPTMHGAAFNFDNFWDGRARHDYNGGSVFGASDPFFHIYVDCGSLEPLAHPLEAEIDDSLCEWTEVGGNYMGSDENEDPIPVRIRFSSLGSQAMGPPLSEFEMSFFGRNWQKIGKKMLQPAACTNPMQCPSVTPLANQLVAVDDSRLGAWSNQGGANCAGTNPAPGKPGLCITYNELIQQAFREELWSNNTQQLLGQSVPMNNDCDPGEQLEVGQATCDPFDGYVISTAGGQANPFNPNVFTQMDANFGLFFGISVQAYEQLLIPDDTPWDQFNDRNPRIGSGIAQPGEQGTLPPQGIREAVTGSPDGALDLPPGITPDVIYGFDIFTGGNVTAALAPGQSVDPESGIDRNPDGIGGRVGSNPFLRSARCMLCHLGPEQTDHTNNVQAGLLKSGTEVEFPSPPGTPEPTGNLMFVSGFALSEEVEENAQDGVEVENQDFLIFGETGPGAAVLVNANVAPASGSAFGDNGVYNIGVRPPSEDIGRGGDDAFGFPLSLAALAMKNLGGEDYEPCDGDELIGVECQGTMALFNPDFGPGGGLYDEVGAGVPFEGTGPNDCAEVIIAVGPGAPRACEQSSINPGFNLEPANPQLPEYLAEFANNLPAGELSPQIDELGFAPNHLTPVPSAEYGEILFGADMHCGVYDPASFGPATQAPNFGWGPNCPNSQTGVPVNMQLSQPGNGENYIAGSLVMPMNGTWPMPNRVRRNASFKAPQLRNVELTGPYFHTGSYLTLRQVVDFYVRGSDFPVTSAAVRDGNIADLMQQAFSFGSTIALDPVFSDGRPDVTTLYGTMPDTFPPGCETGAGNCTPEPATSTPEQAKIALVKFLLALTDERVAEKRPPFDQPEIFVPFDGTAPENTGGRPMLMSLSQQSCPSPAAGDGNCFERIPATSASLPAPRSSGFLGVTNNPNADCTNEISHFCR